LEPGVVIVAVAVVTQIALLVSWRRNSSPTRQKREVLVAQLDAEPVPVAEGRIAIFQDMPGFGDPRIGAFAVYIDGKPSAPSTLTRLGPVPLIRGAIG
jgi:hypothetical protein